MKLASDMAVPGQQRSSFRSGARNVDPKEAQRGYVDDCFKNDLQRDSATDRRTDSPEEYVLTAPSRWAQSCPWMIPHTLVAIGHNCGLDTSAYTMREGMLWKISFVHCVGAPKGHDHYTATTR